MDDTTVVDGDDAEEGEEDEEEDGVEEEEGVGVGWEERHGLGIIEWAREDYGIAMFSFIVGDREQVAPNMYVYMFAMRGRKLFLCL